MFAVISDIHANLEALDAVLADIARRPVSAIYCLGDLVGFGPNPIECIERARKWDVSVIGDYDEAVLFDSDRFDRLGGQSIFWTRGVLQSSGRKDLWEFLTERPRMHRQDNFLFVHGSPRDPINEYVFPEDVYGPKMKKIAALIDPYCFCGHTHIPGVFVKPEAPDEQWTFFSPEDCNHCWRLDERKTLINVGAVGQPRDGNPRACYVTVDGCDVTFHRIEYDWLTTHAKIYAIPELDHKWGDILGDG